MDRQLPCVMPSGFMLTPTSPFVAKPNIAGTAETNRMSATQAGIKEYRYFADNQWRSATDNTTFEVHEPYSGKPFARVAAGSRADARAAVDAASKAFTTWSEAAPAERARLFLKAAEIVKRRRAEIAEILARETGSTISFATFQQDLVAATLQQVAGSMFLPN